MRAWQAFCQLSNTPSPEIRILTTQIQGSPDHHGVCTLTKDLGEMGGDTLRVEEEQSQGLSPLL